MKYRTCVSIGEKNPKKLKSVLKKALSKSDYAEIRFDFLKKSDIPIVLETVKKNLSRCVCTLRPKSEGGLFVGKEDERTTTTTGRKRRGDFERHHGQSGREHRKNSKRRIRRTRKGRKFE